MIVDKDGNDITKQFFKKRKHWDWFWESEEAYRAWLKNVAEAIAGPNSPYAKSRKKDESDKDALQEM